MKGGLTTAEKTMMDFGEADQVRAFRQTFEKPDDRPAAQRAGRADAEEAAPLLRACAGSATLGVPSHRKARDEDHLLR
jgi:hypothetical protein